MYMMKLYIAGKTRNSRRALDNIRRVCQEELLGDFELTIIDVLEHPEVAEAEKVLATPTLVKNGTSETRRLVGDLADLEKLLDALDIEPPAECRVAVEAAMESRAGERRAGIPSAPEERQRQDASACSAGVSPAQSECSRDGCTTSAARDLETQP